MKRIVIGMTAHVDSGKTTLSEAMLYKSGELRKAGRVDKGDTFLDNHSVERSRGITVFSKQAVMNRGDNVYTLLDTPGHVDFSAEAERALRAIDYAVLVISGLDGVQSHTETLWKLLARYNIPAFVFVNKMDISKHTREYLLADMKRRLSDRITDFELNRNSDERNEELAAFDEAMMNEFFDSGDIPENMIIDAIADRKVFPCLFGSALKFDGVENLMNCIDRYAVMPRYPEQFGAQVYKITEDGGTRLTHIKVTGGSLKVKSVMESGEKINQIRIYSGTKYSLAEEVFSGQLCAVTGLAKSYAGEGMGIERNAEKPMLEPVLSYRVILPDGIDAHTMLIYLKKLEEEDPQLSVVWNEQLREIHIRLMGEIQLEILRTVVKERFGVSIEFDRGNIAYKETILQPVEGVGHYEPLRHYAEVHLLMEPAPEGSGMHFYTDCPEDSLDRNWQRLILTHLEEKTHCGVLTGSPITDMNITLLAGRAHLKHTEGGDFRQATYRAVRMGLMSAECVLLEPYYDFTLEIPSECTGRALNDLQRMCGGFEAPENYDGSVIIKGSAPVSEMAGYHTDVAGYSSGKGRLSCVLKGYFTCHNAEDVISKIGYNAESDLDNSPDSVFCAHGAGFAVKWNEVRSYMHIDSGIRFGNENEEQAERVYIPKKPEKNYSDEELMSVFEQTYGKIDREPRKAMRRVHEPDYSKHKSKPLPPGPGYLLVDGYNIIFSWDELKNIAKDNLDLARSRLIDILCNYQGFKQCSLILVFDAYKVKGNHREIEQTGGISVVYTKEAETADMYIEKVTHKLAKDNRVRVATSDGAEQIIILGNGAYRISAAEFYEEVKAAEKSISEIIQKPQTEKKTVNTIKGSD